MLRFFLIMIFLTTTFFVKGQEVIQQKLEERKAAIQREILQNQKDLQQIKSKEKNTLKVVTLQGEKIRLKENLIKITESQVKKITHEISINEEEINRVNQELSVLKKEYGDMIFRSYKSRSEHSRVMFLLSSENFTQAYKRTQYMKQYTTNRREKAEEMTQKRTKINQLNNSLSAQTGIKQQLVIENLSEKEALLKEKKDQERELRYIQKNKSQLLAELKGKQREIQLIDKQINKIIREAITAANKKSGTLSDYSSKIILTPQGKIESDNFKLNQKKLPWPVEKGFISLRYGSQPHPIYNSLMINNSGVEITTAEGSLARTVFAGEVMSIMILSPVNKAVMVKHGDFFTVYQNLSTVSVEKGDQVKLKQPLGKIRTNPEGKTILKFTVSQNTTYLDPEEWLFIN